MLLSYKMECFNCLGSMITNDTRCTRDNKSRISIAKSNIQHDDDSFSPGNRTSKFKEETIKVHDPGVDSASNRNEYQEYFLGVKVDGAKG